MRQRNGYLPGVPCWVDSSQPDPRAAAQFYGGLFGWRLTDRMPPDAPGNYYMAQLEGRDVAAISSQSTPPAPPRWSTYIAVADADGVVQRIKAAGGKVVTEPQDVLTSGRMAVCADPTGAEFRIWQSGEHRGAQLVNEPGTWNWSNLATTDPAKARAFYRDVFGWDADPGDDKPAMLRLPGYGDYLEEHVERGLRDRQAEQGAPAGFADAVAWMARTSSPAERSTWDVTFAVADVDAIVGRARALGGAVVVPPFSVPFARLAVLRDPQGATFTINAFLPS